MASRKHYKAIKSPRPKALIVRCSDPRFRIAFRDFAIEELELNQGEFVPINVAGGPAALAHKRLKQADFLYLVGQMSFFCQHFRSINKIILIGHEACGYYKTVRHNHDTDPEKKDLPEAAKAITKIFCDAWRIQVVCYYASFADAEHTEIVFEKI